MSQLEYETHELVDDITLAVGPEVRERITKIFLEEMEKAEVRTLKRILDSYGHLFPPEMQKIATEHVKELVV